VIECRTCHLPIFDPKGSPGLFHVEKLKGAPRRFTMYYVLRRTP
jgi:hypothetical protein